MKKKRLWKRLGFFLLTLGLILVYLAVYLFPALIDINHYRREIKDVKLRLQDLNREVLAITFSDKREKKMFRRTDTKYRSRIPVLKNRRDRNKWQEKLVSYIRNTAGKQGIHQLIMTDADEVPNVLIHSDFPAKNELAGLLGEEFKNPQQPLLQDFPSGERVYSDIYSLGFQVPISFGLRALTGMVNYPFQLEIAEIRIVAGPGSPYFLLALRVFYRKKTAPGRMDDPPERISESFIDLNSPLLLRPVYHYYSADKTEKALPIRAFKSIFVKEKEVTP
ncbi:MAG: hypothetical protein KAS65_12060 [Candidatus Aminicenantes bacterium]|nr:hypothetical protein [Candidatus Aminicenantes bacterium]